MLLDLYNVLVDWQPDPPPPLVDFEKYPTVIKMSANVPTATKYVQKRVFWSSVKFVCFLFMVQCETVGLISL